MSDELETILKEEKIDTVEKTITIEPDPIEETEDLDAAFKEHLREKSEHKFEEEQNEEQNENTEGGQAPKKDPEPEFDMAADFKLKLFLNLCFLLLDGIHAFIYSMFSKYKLKREDIALDEEDREGLEMYFRTPRVMGLINKIPPEIIGIIHIEYIYFEKFRDFKKEQEEKEQAALAEQKEKEEQEQEEQEEQEQEEQQEEEQQEEEQQEEPEQEQEEEQQQEEQPEQKPKRKYKKRKRSRKKATRKKPVKKEDKA